MTSLGIRIGGSIDDAGDEFVAAWKAAEIGEVTTSVDHLTFVDWAALCSVLTPERFEVIRQLRREPSPDVQALARTLGRSEQRVRRDVVALSGLGLVRSAADGGLSAPFAEISSTIRFAA